MLQLHSQSFMAARYSVSGCFIPHFSMPHGAACGSDNIAFGLQQTLAFPAVLRNCALLARAGQMQEVNNTTRWKRPQKWEANAFPQCTAVKHPGVNNYPINCSGKNLCDRCLSFMAWIRWQIFLFPFSLLGRLGDLLRLEYCWSKALILRQYRRTVQCKLMGQTRGWVTIQK